MTPPADATPGPAAFDEPAATASAGLLALHALLHGEMATQDAAAVAWLEAHGCLTGGTPCAPSHVSEDKRVQAPLAVWADYLEWRFAGRVDAVRVYQETGSTQDAAAQLARATGKESWPGRVVVLADTQRAGRGRLGRSWQAESGHAVLLSLAVPAGAAPERLAAAAAVAVADTVRQWVHARAEVGVRWPNDVLIDGEKVAGVLIEQRGASVILGVGLNVHQAPDLTAPAASHATGATCLDAHVAGDQGTRPVRLAVAGALIDALLETLQRDDQALLCAWRAYCLQWRKSLSVRYNRRPYRGEVVDLDLTLGLLLRTSTGELVHLPAAQTSRHEPDETAGVT